jgi:hypothetical protein
MSAQINAAHACNLVISTSWTRVHSVLVHYWNALGEQREGCVCVCVCVCVCFIFILRNVVVHEIMSFPRGVDLAAAK